MDKINRPDEESSAQQRPLEGQLPFQQGTGALGKDRLQMLDGLPERIGLRTLRRFLPTAQPTAHGIQSLAQAMAQMIASLQSQEGTHGLRRAFERSVLEPLAEQLPKQRGIEGVAWQNVGQKDRERSPATCTPAAIGTKDPLPSGHAAAGFGGIVAVKNAVPV